MNRPFTLVTMFFMLGILLSRIWLINLSLGVILVIFAFLLLGMEFFKKASMVWLGLLLMLFGFFVHQHQFPTSSKLEVYGNDLPTMEVQVLGKPTPRYNNLEVEIKVINLQRNNQHILIKEKAQLQIRGGASLEIKPGDRLEIVEGKIKKQLNSRDLQDYDLYLRSKGLRYQLVANIGRVKVIPQEGKFNPLVISNQVKEYTENFFDQTLQEPQQEIMKSVLFGNQGYLSPEIRKAFSRSGTAHMVAVSGLHIGIIVLMLEKFLMVLKVGRNKRLVGISGAILVYGFIVGFPVSIIRAGAMYMLYVLAYFLDRRYDSINCLMLIAFVTLTFNPLALFSVAFQLSFSATLSILVLYPIIKGIPVKLPMGIKNLLAVTLAAQVGTIPIIAYHFQEISIISLVVNLLIVPTLGVLLSLGFISVIVSLISHQLGAIINYFTNGLLTYIYWMVEVSSKLPYSSLEVGEMSQFGIIIYYIILVLAIHLFESGKHLLFKESWRKNELSKTTK